MHHVWHRYHFSRYGDDTAEPLTEALAGTVARNTAAAKKELTRAAILARQAAATASAQ